MLKITYLCAIAPEVEIPEECGCVIFISHKTPARYICRYVCMGTPRKRVTLSLCVVYL